MSLFGTSPDEEGTSQTRPHASASSLFNDDSTNDSPWSMPTPKKNARQNLVKNLLPANEVPDFYVDAYDTVLRASDASGANVTLSAVKNILSSSGLSASEQDRILNFVAPSGQDVTSLGRPEFNVLLALIGLGQEGDDITLDGVDERRRKLPQPKIAYIDKLRAPAQPKQTPTKDLSSTPATIRPAQRPRQDSMGDLTSDPWGSSPRDPRIPPPSTAAHTFKPTMPDDFTSAPTNGTVRTTSTFTTSNDQQTNTSVSVTQSQSSGGDGSGWGSYNGGASGGFSEQPTLGGGGFGDGNEQSNGAGRPSQPTIGASVVVPPGTGEVVTVTMLPEKEGMFLFQHRNYEVKAIRRGSSVVRRYSDFVWLLDCLQKRYPFRRLPLLPPKRVQVNGNHLAADSGSFLEKRRKGLVRFTNALVQHPVLSQETLIIMFLTVPSELSVWRKQATISVQEEFTGKILPPTLEDSLPSTLPDLFDQVRAGVRRSTEVYINLCALVERLVRRNEGLAADSLRITSALQSLTETTTDSYAVDTNDVPLLNEGINATAKHLSSSQTLLEDEAKAWDSGVLEDLKSIRDAMVSMRDVFDRRDKYAGNTIPKLEKRIEASENKLHALRQKPQGQVKEGEIEKVESSILSDKESIVQQHARGVFIKECIRDEIVTFQTTIYATTRLHRDWGEERVKYSELQASNWRALVDQLESMPAGES